MAGAPAIEIDRVSKRFGKVQALSNLSLKLPAGRFLALLGPSGCGKTTLMRMIAGFEAPDQGAIRIEGADMNGVLPEKRPVNMMFQSYALFPHMTVADNVAFGLRRLRLPRRQVAEGVDHMLRLVQLQGLADRKPDQLSGGQRQRVALARALARRPRILLLDEPLGALDRKLREETQFALKDIQRELGTTFLIVTHDQDEALGLADLIALMREGRIEQIGPPHTLYEKPASRFVANFVGETNVFEGVVHSVDAGRVTVMTRDGPRLVDSRGKTAPGMRVAFAVRPERMMLVARKLSVSWDDVNVFQARLRDKSYRGSTTLLRVRLPSGALVRVASADETNTRLAEGDEITLRFQSSDAWLLHGDA